ncbi:unnamed protein product [Mycena citricolor]|uniref:DUF6533 domain-containing protein n=1 Tax=Mycena citricolor TaxID=2018698 RepID=A0AAD2HG65_9AGAR|nr:unnamed protein product [Mycena citricolor]
MSSADALGAEQALLLQLLKDSTLTNELAVAALSIVVVEHIATLRDEIDLVWRTRISLANVFYIWIRYFTLGVICFSVYNLVRPQDSDRVCQNFFYVLLSTCTLIVVSADFILALRVWILFHRSRTLLYFLVPLLMAELTGMLVTGYFAIVDLKVYVHAPGLTGCYSQDVPRLLTYYAVPPFLMATTMFAMTLHRCRLSLVTSRAFGRGPIIAMFLRDGVFWFLGVVRKQPGNGLITVNPLIDGALLSACDCGDCHLAHSAADARPAPHSPRDIIDRYDRCPRRLEHQANSCKSRVGDRAARIVQLSRGHPVHCDPCVHDEPCVL